jgi:hypothetical protein
MLRFNIGRTQRAMGWLDFHEYLLLADVAQIDWTTFVARRCQRHLLADPL